jgi:hypothetical protein
MDNQNEDPVLCLEEDGDESISAVYLDLWNICLSVQRKFGAEVIFTYSSVNYPAESDAHISFYVPRHHARAVEIEVELQEALEPIRQQLSEFNHEANGWQPTVNVWIYRYSGIVGAMAFDEASRRVMKEGLEQDQVDHRRVLELASSEGRKAAMAALSRH